MNKRSFTVAGIFGDYMVLQREKPIKIWGTSRVEQTINVFINVNEVVSTRIMPGEWQITLPAMEAARGLEIKITGDAQNDELIFKNVAIGEVWIAGGQSNMEFALEFDAEAKKVIPQANNPDIRFYDCPKVKFEGQENQDDYSQVGFWRGLTPQNAPFYSAVGFYFASKLYERYRVPVGILGCNWGGTTAATWMDERYLVEDDELSVYWQEYQNGLEKLDIGKYITDEKKARDDMKSPMMVSILRKILEGSLGPVLKMIVLAGMRSMAKNAPALGPYSENRPGGLYHMMLKKIAGFTVRGVIWYQGESDDLKAGIYARLFAAMIRCWRDAWQDELPFLFVQLAPWERWLALNALNFPIIREQQDLVSRTIPGAHMVSIMDYGERDDVHPKHKRPVGERLALLARGKVYGEDILCEAPEAQAARFENGDLVIPFLYTGNGLFIKGKSLESLELIADGKKLEPIKVSITPSSVRVQVTGLSFAKELEIRFAYRNFAEVNLYNSADLPAKPFRQVIEVR